MKDDIVKRLRATETVGSPLMPWHVTPAEAADEIEDLRAELKEFTNQYQQLKRELEECLSGVTWIVRPPND